MLPADALLALVIFGAVSSVTPGPNNMMLLASGVNFGLRRTVPHMLGVSLGFGAMVLLVGLGLGQIFALLPWLHVVIRIAGLLYMLRLAWLLAANGTMGSPTGRARPMTFLEAAAFQWVNPKAWAMAVSAIAAYTLAADFVLSVVIVALVFTVVNLPAILVWAAFGAGMARFLSDPWTVRMFNMTMATLLVASLYPSVLELITPFL
jgi:threonine/homoserine/homoserine lactone efflux protein